MIATKSFGNFVSKLCYHGSRFSEIQSFRNFSTSPLVANQTTGLCYDLTESQRSLIDMAEKFSREEIMPNAAKYDKSGEYPWDIFKKAHELGFRTGSIPVEYGGEGINLVDTCLMVEKLSYGCTGITTAIMGHGLAMSPIELFGSHEQKKEYFGRLLADPVTCSYAVTEPGTGSDVSAVKTRAERTKDGDYILNGQKMWITNAGHASWYFVLARTNPDPKCKASQAFTGFLVERDSPGLTVGRKEINMGQRACDTRGITFENVLVPKKNVLVGEGQGFKIAMGAFDLTRAPVGCQAVGLAQRALDEATKYSVERETFGVPIAQHQAVQFMIADMRLSVDLGRMAYMRAAWEYTQGRSGTFWASVAKLYGSEAASKCAADAVQIFGGAGYNSEYPVEKLMRDAKIFEIYEGTSQIQRLIIVREHYKEFLKGVFG